MSKIISRGNHRFLALDKFLSPIIEKFSIKPDKDFARYLFGIFNTRRIYYYAINGEMCFTLKEFAKYLQMPYNTIKSAFQRKKLDINKHYLEVGKTNSVLRDKLHLNKRGGKEGKMLIFLTFLGVWKLLPSFRNEVAIELYDWFGEKLYSLMKSDQLSSGEFFLSDHSGKIIQQILGDKDKCFIDEEGFMYASKGEMLIAKTLRELGYKFQYNAPIYLTKALISKLHKDESLLDILVEANWFNIPSYITCDFLLRTKPRTIIEYWGMENNLKYNAKRKIKEFIYRELKIRLISVNAHEDQNIPILKKKLMKELS